MERVLSQSRYGWRGLHGGYRERLDCAWILSPALFFARDLFLSFILFKVSLGLKNNFKNFKLNIFIMLFIYLYVNIINMLLWVL